MYDFVFLVTGEQIALKTLKDQVNNDARLCLQDITLVNWIGKNEIVARMSMGTKMCGYILRVARQIPILFRYLFLKISSCFKIREKRISFKKFYE